MTTELTFIEIQQHILDHLKINRQYPKQFILDNIEIINKRFNINLLDNEYLNLNIGQVGKILKDDIDPICTCGKMKTWARANINSSCGKFPCVGQSIQKTILEKHGVTNIMKKDEIKEKTKLTNIQRYGSECYFSTPEFKEKSKKTSIEKYGVDNASQTKESRLKAKNTTLERYGVENVSHSRIFREKAETTSIIRYGYKFTFNDPLILEKTKQSNLLKYGVEYPTQSDTIREKTKQSNLLKYGAEYPTQQHLKNLNNLTKEYIESNFIDIENNTLKLYEFMNFYNYLNNPSVYRKLKELNIDYTKLGGISRAEIEIKEFLQNQNQNILLELNTKQVISPEEIDIYLPESNTGIEYNGLYWHSYGKEEDNTNDKQFNKAFQTQRHLKKTEAFEALSKEHQLFHIFENEWEDIQKQDIWKSILSNRLNTYKHRIHARKCVIKEITSKEANKFIINNHIQGIRNAKYKIGLFYNEELVSVMTLGSDLNNNESEDDSYELIRFCNKKYTVIPGAASKLLKYFETNYNPKCITSYANRRWSKGDLYHKLGFELVNVSKPNKFIIDMKTFKLYNRIAFQKHKLEEILESFNSQLSADENCINNNLRIIWDSGNYVFKKEY